MNTAHQDYAQAVIDALTSETIYMDQEETYGNLGDTLNVPKVFSTRNTSQLNADAILAKELEVCKANVIELREKVDKLMAEAAAVAATAAWAMAATEAEAVATAAGGMARTHIPFVGRVSDGARNQFNRAHNAVKDFNGVHGSRVVGNADITTSKKQLEWQQERKIIREQFEEDKATMEKHLKENKERDPEQAEKEQREQRELRAQKWKVFAPQRELTEIQFGNNRANTLCVNEDQMVREVAKRLGKIMRQYRRYRGP